MKRQNATRMAAALVAMAACVAIAGAVAGLARTTAGTTAGPKSHPEPGSAAALPSCPKATICAFSGPNATGKRFSFPTSANHSRWIDFSKVIRHKGSPFHPDSIIDNSGSDIFLYDAQGGKVAGPYCALGTRLRSYTFSDFVPVNGGTAAPPSPPAPGYKARTYQPGWFFIQYNVNTCVGPEPTPLPAN
jgi:hypothetical protein